MLLCATLHKLSNLTGEMTKPLSSVQLSKRINLYRARESLYKSVNSLGLGLGLGLGLWLGLGLD